MYPQSDSPIKEVPFGEALKLSLDNYYDLLKEKVGSLAAEEYIQLKLVADVLDLSDEKAASEGGYKWFSYYNLLKRSDRSIVPAPVSGEVQLGNPDLHEVYGRFLHRLRKFAVRKDLSTEDQLLLADLDKSLERTKERMREYAILDRTNWQAEAEAMGYEIGDMSAYVQWSNLYGHLREIENLYQDRQDLEFKKKTVLDRQYPDPDDREIVEAEFDYENPSMRLRYPTHGDFEYSSGDNFSISYLATLPLGSTALFDDRRAISWDKTLAAVKETTGGAFSVTLDRNTQESESITTDWKASGSVRYGLFKAKASVSEHRQITEEFQKGKSLTLAAKAAFKLGIETLGWFKPNLFTHKRVKENVHEFQEFFGKNGSLLYYPSAIILVRGFSVAFDSQANWTYDYKRKFSASGGGGFRAFGIRFGASASYSSNVKEHKVDQTQTTLTISDDEDTIRFVGYAVRKNTVFQDIVEELVDETNVSSIVE